MNFIDETCEILDLLYKHGWDERNGGNLSYIVPESDVKEFLKSEKIMRTYSYDFDMTSIVGKYFLITGTGKYFKNCKRDPETNLGLFKILDKNTIGLLWGLKDGGGPTSETLTHLSCHIERLKVDTKHRLVIHCHPTNIICMTHIFPQDENKWTETLWKMQTESIVVFPEGIGVLPWMLCGGLFTTGKDLDEVFGLIETIEKAAEIYMKICDKKIYQSITNSDLKELAALFKLNYKKGIID